MDATIRHVGILLTEGVNNPLLLGSWLRSDHLVFLIVKSSARRNDLGSLRAHRPAPNQRQGDRLGIQILHGPG